MVLLRLRCPDPETGQLPVLATWGCAPSDEETETGDAGSFDAVALSVAMPCCSVRSLASASARSLACTSLFGGSSGRDTQPCGGLGGGLMKKSF